MLLKRLSVNGIVRKNFDFKRVEVVYGKIVLSVFVV